MSAYVRVSSQMPCYCLPVVFRVTEKTSVSCGFGLRFSGLVRGARGFR